MINEHEAAVIRTIIERHLGASATRIIPLTGGFFSRAYAVTAGNRDYIIRINAAEHARESFEKDDFAWRHFASDELPIPRVVAIGEAEGSWYAVSERLPGTALSRLPEGQRNALLPEMIDVLETVARTNISDTDGYGDWDGSGVGRYRTWTDFLAHIMDNEPEGYYANWHAMFDETFLERDVYERVYRRMMELTEFCPDERALIHNDIQFENVLSDGQRITGVIDWANALYGDPIYDVAHWLWWTGTPGWFSHGDDLVFARFGDTAYFDERIACYQLHIGLDDLKFCAKNGLRDWYAVHRNRLLGMISTRSG